MDDLKNRVEDMLNSPVGCEFVLSVAESGLTPEEVGSPLNGFWLAAESVKIMDIHRGDHAEMIAGALDQGKSLRPLARAILEHPATAWWFDSPDLDHQIWIAHEGTFPITAKWECPSTPPERWERYAQKPRGLQYTSTLVDGLTSLFVAYDNRSGDLGFWPTPLPCWELRVLSNVKIYGIRGAGSWHELCLRYPAKGPGSQGEQDGRLTPDWGAVAADWDGVHLSFGGLLTAEQVGNESPEGWSMLTSWDAEHTYWLGSVATMSERLPDHDRNYEQTKRPDHLTPGDPTPGRQFHALLASEDDLNKMDSLDSLPEHFRDHPHR